MSSLESHQQFMEKIQFHIRLPTLVDYTEGLFDEDAILGNGEQDD